MAYGVIYGLYDPRDGALRYIGQTTRSLQKRLWGHTSQCTRKTTHSAWWLKQLKRLGFVPQIMALGESDSQESLDVLEECLISEARAKGERLTNISAGGYGGQKGVSRKLGADVRAKISAARKGQRLNNDQKQRISSALKVHNRVHGHRGFGGLPGAKHKESSKAKMSASRRGLHAGNKHPKYRHDAPTNEILEYLKGGLSTREIAALLDLSRATVDNRIKASGHMGPKSAKSALPTEVILQTVLNSPTKRLAADRLGIAVSFLYKRLNQARSDGMQVPLKFVRPVKKMEVPTDLILQKLSEGKTKDEVAKELRMSRAGVYRRLSAEGQK